MIKLQDLEALLHHLAGTVAAENERHKKQKNEWMLREGMVRYNGDNGVQCVIEYEIDQGESKFADTIIITRIHGDS